MITKDRAWRQVVGHPFSLLHVGGLVDSQFSRIQLAKGEMIFHRPGLITATLIAMTDAADFDGLRELFLARFQDPIEVLFLDPDRNDTYVWDTHTKWSTEGAVEEVFASRFEVEDLQPLIDELNDIAPDWVDREED